ncbi:class I adenylate-forming enzyme family protein [Amycolatopsis kentuckyensis]|uniref:class I adenylate-forming enzyme family protein n=1 Tax=Amycolatopsis kentuckyensis TaxID=218823 RepID=UPI000A390FA2|nr:fatty acid--CoA ligase family protein [Amycolatopsis kentuckyensis]
MTMTIEQVLDGGGTARLVVGGVEWPAESLLRAGTRLAGEISRRFGDVRMLTTSTADAALIVAAVAAAGRLGVPVLLRDPAATGTFDAADVLIGDRPPGDPVPLGENLGCHLAHLATALPVPLPGESILFQTSGSTAAPKAVVKPVDAVLRDAARIATALHGEGAPDAVVCAAPVYHSYGFTHGLLAGLLAGAETTYRPPSSLPQSLVKTVASTGAGTLVALPNHVHMIADAGSLDFGGVRQVVSAGAPLRPDAVARICRGHGFRLLNAYGASEVGTMAIAALAETSAPGSIGSPLAGVDLRIGPGEGELLARNDSFATGYFTEGRLRPLPAEDGWYRTGDLAERDADGLRITGRLGDLINIAGRKTRRSRLEAVLSAHPDVAEVQVIVTEDAVRGEFPVARAVVAPGRERPDLLGWSRTRLDAFEVPRQVEWVDRLPRTSTGKLSYAPRRADGGR